MFVCILLGHSVMGFCSDSACFSFYWLALVFHGLNLIVLVCSLGFPWFASICSGLLWPAFLLGFIFLYLAFPLLSSVCSAFHQFGLFSLLFALASCFRFALPPVRVCGQMVSDCRFLSARQVRRQVRGKCGTHCPNSPMSSICSSRTPGCSVSLSPATKSQNIVMSPVLQDVVQGPCHRGLMQRPLPPSASILFCNRLPSQAWCQNWDVGQFLSDFVLISFLTRQSPRE